MIFHSISYIIKNKGLYTKNEVKNKSKGSKYKNNKETVIIII